MNLNPSQIKLAFPGALQHTKARVCGWGSMVYKTNLKSTLYTGVVLYEHSASVTALTLEVLNHEQGCDPPRGEGRCLFQMRNSGEKNIDVNMRLKFQSTKSTFLLKISSMLGFKLNDTLL